MPSVGLWRLFHCPFTKFAPDFPRNAALAAVLQLAGTDKLTIPNWAVA
jgi:hypothetical protein